MFVAIWKRVPVGLQAILVGLCVSAVVLVPWMVMVTANFSLWPQVPWCLPLMTVYLWISWRYLGGWGWPRSTSEARRRLLRADTLSPLLWRWSLVTGGFAWASLSAVSQVLRRLYTGEITPLWVSQLSGLPVPTLMAAFVTISLVAGITEEAAWRGYAQTWLRRRYSPFASTLIVALVFTLAHWMPYGRMPPVLFTMLLAVSLVYGWLAHLSGSILPGVVLHVTGDAFGMIFGWWSRRFIGGPLRLPLLRDTGVDSHFVGSCAAVVLFGLACLWSFRRLAVAAGRVVDAGDERAAGLGPP